MKLKIYSIQDSKSKSFGQVIIQRTHGEAERWFKHEVNKPQSFLGQYPEDFDLFYLGEMDSNEGKIVGLSTPEHIIKATQVRESNTTSQLN